MLMRVENVPIDMSSEQKDILGILSKRQLMYLAGGGLLLYSYLPIVFKFLNNFIGTGILVAAIGSLFAAVPVVVIVGFFGFVKLRKSNMNSDFYYWIRLQRKTQRGSWRKGI